MILIQKRQDKLAGNIGLLKFQKAEKNAKSYLKKASKSLENNDLSNYYNNLSQALFGYLEDKLKMPTAEFTLDKALDKIKQITDDDSLIDRIKKISEKCEFARFAPSAVGDDKDGEIFKSVQSIIQEIESSINGKK